MKQNKLFLAIEFVVLFVALPVSLLGSFSIRLKIGLVLIAFVYILFTLAKALKVKIRIKKDVDWNSFFRRILITFMLVAGITAAYVWIQDKEALFYVPRTNLKLYIAILFVYTLFSVWPQEIIYRTFFFKRYEQLFANKTLHIFVNAVVFSLAHLFFKNTLVLVLTFVGGIVFGYTFLKYRSTTAVTIEHALYGNWLFTVGMGEMLAFPGMETL